MEILFMVFMVVVSTMSLFAVMVVLRDIVKEILTARREREKSASVAVQPAEQSAAPAPAAAAPAAQEAAPAPAAAEPTPAVQEAPAAEQPAEQPAATEEAEAEDEGTITFAAGRRQTLEEKYLALSAEARGWYDEIMKYAAAVEGSKRFKNVRYEEYKVGMNRLVRMLIKRGAVHCEFILHNSDFKNYINENKISVKQAATTMVVDSAATVDAVKNSIDIVVAAIAEEKEHKKQLARERRKAARANNEAVVTTTEE